MFCCSKKSSTVVVPAIQIQKPEENIPTQETEINGYEQVPDASLKDSLTPPPFERGETFLIDRRPPARIENYSDLGENSAPIVIDAGSETMKVGFAGSNAPRVISNVVGFSKGKVIFIFIGFYNYNALFFSVRTSIIKIFKLV